MKLATKKNITSGNLLVGILSFAFPLFISTMVQTLFTAVDTIVVGNFADSLAVASIGASNSVTFILVNCFISMAAGANVLVARAIGANDTETVKKTVDSSLIFAAVFGIILMVSAFLLSVPMLRLMKCPADCFDSAVLYLRIYMCATPFILIHNFAAAIIRAEGDSTRPLTYIMISGSANVITNILLCLVLPNKVAAVAVATLLSHVIAASLTVRRLITKKDGFCRVSFKNMQFHWKSLGAVLRFGVPLVLSNAIYPLANLQIQPTINSYGAAALAGQTAGQQINNLLSSLPASFNSTCLTFASQNIGAHNRKRVEKTIIICCTCAVSAGLILGMSSAFLFPEQLLSLFVPGDAEAIVYGKTYMKYVTSAIFLSGINGCLSTSLQAFGYPIFTTANNLFSVLGFRIIWMNFIYVLAPSIDMLFVCFTLSWSLIFVVSSCFLVFVYRKYRKQEMLYQST